MKYQTQICNIKYKQQILNFFSKLNSLGNFKVNNMILFLSDVLQLRAIYVKSY